MTVHLPARDAGGDWFLPFVAYADVEVRIAEMERAARAGRSVPIRLYGCRLGD